MWLRLFVGQRSEMIAAFFWRFYQETDKNVPGSRVATADTEEVRAHERSSERGDQEELHPSHALQRSWPGQYNATTMTKEQGVVPKNKATLLGMVLDKKVGLKVHLAERVGKAPKV